MIDKIKAEARAKVKLAKLPSEPLIIISDCVSLTGSYIQKQDSHDVDIVIRDKSFNTEKYFELVRALKKVFDNIHWIPNETGCTNDHIPLYHLALIPADRVKRVVKQRSFVAEAVAVADLDDLKKRAKAFESGFTVEPYWSERKIFRKTGDTLFFPDRNPLKLKGERGDFVLIAEEREEKGVKRIIAEDIWEWSGEKWFGKSWKERREKLKSAVSSLAELSTKQTKIVLMPSFEGSSGKDIENMTRDSVEAGALGVIIKDLDAKYGKRGSVLLFRVEEKKSIEYPESGCHICCEEDALD